MILFHSGLDLQVLYVSHSDNILYMKHEIEISCAHTHSDEHSWPTWVPVSCPMTLWQVEGQGIEPPTLWLVTYSITCVAVFITSLCLQMSSLQEWEKAEKRRAVKQPKPTAVTDEMLKRQKNAGCQKKLLWVVQRVTRWDWRWQKTQTWALCIRLSL